MHGIVRFIICFLGQHKVADVRQTLFDASLLGHLDESLTRFDHRLHGHIVGVTVQESLRGCDMNQAANRQTQKY